MEPGPFVPDDLSESLSIQVEERLQNGHSKKAEKALTSFIAGMPVEDLKAVEHAVRTISTKFLPGHKARHRRIAELISSRLATPPDMSVALQKSAVVQPSADRNLTATTSKAELRELQYHALVAEMRPLGFRTSDEVSAYIMENRLGEKYGHISGILKMQKGADQWDFPGGIAPEIYGRLCNALGLGNRGTDATWTDFVPFSNLHNGP